MNLKTISIAAVAAFTVLTAASSEASSRSLVQQSHQLESIVGQLRTEFREHYDHTSIYRHLINDAAAIERESEHVHSLAHNYFASFTHILHDLEQIDELAHHIHDMVDAADRGRYGHVHGDTRHVHSLLSSLTNTIHNMERTVRADAAHRHSDHGHGHGHDHDRGRGHDDHGHSSGRTPVGDPRVEIARGIFRAIINR